MVKKFIYGFGIMCTLFGCSPEKSGGASDSVSRRQKPGVYLGDDQCSLYDLSPESVILVVNGEKFTKRDFVVAQTMFDKISRLRARDSLTGPNKKAEEAVRRTDKRTVGELLRRALVRQYAKKLNIEPTAELIEKYAKQATKVMRQPEKTLEEIAEMFGGSDGDLLLEYNRGDALDEALRRHFDSENRLDPSDEHIMQVSNRWLKAQADSVKSNAVQKAMLEKAILEIKSGVDFVEVAKKYSSSPEDAVEWDDFLLEEFEESPQVSQWLKTANDGDISSVLEMDDGWAVIKVLSCHLEELPPNDVSLPRTMWRLVRISRPLYETVDDLPRDEIVKMLIEYHSKQIQKRVGDAIMKEAVIEWPYGTNLFPNVENVAPKQVNVQSTGTKTSK